MDVLDGEEGGEVGDVPAGCSDVAGGGGSWVVSETVEGLFRITFAVPGPAAPASLPWWCCHRLGYFERRPPDHTVPSAYLARLYKHRVHMVNVRLYIHFQ